MERVEHADSAAIIGALYGVGVLSLLRSVGQCQLLDNITCSHAQVGYPGFMMMED
jgi:hypothetical protein